MNLGIQQLIKDKSKVLKLNGEVDAYTAPKLRETLIPLTEEKDAEVIVDLHEVQYMDSTGLGIFVGALKSSKEFGSTLKLRGMTERVRRLFEITGLSEIMDIDNDIEEGAQ
jgi:anti-sigma B factor antagonist